MRTQRLCREDSTDRLRALVLPGLRAPDQTGAGDHLTARAQDPPRMSREFARYGLSPGLTFLRNTGHPHQPRGMRFPPTLVALARVLNGRTR